MKSFIHILHLEDDTRDAELVQATLQSAEIACQITRVQSCEDFTQAIHQGEYDLILAAYHLPNYDGMSALRLVQERCPETPFIVVSGVLVEDAAIEALTQGASDYVLKHKLARLVPAVTRALREAENRNERQRAEVALRDSEARYRRITEAITDYMYTVRVVEGQAVETRHGPGCLAVTGYSAEEFAADPYLWIRMVVTDDLPAVQEQARRVLAGEPAPAIEHRIVRKDGAVRWVCNTPVPRRDGQDVLQSYDGLIQDITERKQAERDLQRSNDLLRAIIEAAPTAIIGLDLDGHVQMVWNPAAEKMLGWSAQDVMGRPLPSVPVESQEEFRRFREWIRSGKTLEGVEVRRQKRDGSPIDYSIYASPLHDAEGQIIGNIAVLVDITERKRAEEELRRYQNIVSSTPDGIAFLDEHYRYRIVNDVYERFSGVNREQFLGRTAAEYLGEEVFQQQVKPYFDRCLQGETISYQDWFDYPTLGKRFVTVTYFPYKDRHNHIVGVVADTRDITERKQVEEALWESEARYRELADSITDVFFAFDKDLRYTYWNKASEILTGIPAQDALGKSLYDLFPNTSQTRKAEKVYLDVLRTQQPQMFVNEYQIEGKDFVYEISVYPSRDGISVFTKDITERKRAEEALRESESRLRVLFNSAKDNILIHPIGDDGIPGKYSDVNASTCDILGYTQEELLQMGPQDTTVVDDPSVIAEIGRQIVEEGHALFEAYGMSKDGKRIPFEIHSHLLEIGGTRFVMSVSRDITERKRAEQERLTYLRFLETIDRVNRAMQGTNDLEQMMSDVLDVVLSIFECDRAWFVYPCDPEAATWRTPMERTRPEYPGALILNLEMPVDSQVIRVYKAVLASGDPVGFGPGNEQSLPADVAKKFNEQSQLAMAVYPKVDKPYMFGIHQCSRPRVWTQEERRFLKEIGRRLEDALTSLLIYRKLRQSERLMADIATNYPNSYVSIIEQDFTIGFTSGQEFKKQKLDPRSFEGLSLEQVFGEQMPTVREHYLKAFQGEETSFELFMNNQYQQYNVVPLYDQHGHVTRILAVIENITERKRTEEALQNSQEQLALIIDTLPVLIGYVDSEQRYLYVNQRYADWYGASKEELVGKRLKEVVYEKSYQGIVKHVQAVLQGQEVSFENISYDLEGQLRAVKATYVPHFDENGQVKAFLGLVQDITERKRAEEQLKKSLREKEVLLQELYHRTKNNMNVIGAMLSMQAEDIDDQRLTRILEEIKQRILSMSMVHEQLYNSQDLSHVNLRAYTKQLADSLLANYRVGSGNIALKVEIEPIVVLIETAIPYGLIINELMTNALKYAFPDDRDGEIRIALRRLPGEKELELWFCDNGIGLPEDLDIRETPSFGMKLITLLVDLQFKGTVDVQVNNGTEFRIRFQELDYKARV